MPWRSGRFGCFGFSLVSFADSTRGACRAPVRPDPRRSCLIALEDDGQRQRPVPGTSGAACRPHTCGVRQSGDHVIWERTLDACAGAAMQKSAPEKTIDERRIAMRLIRTVEGVRRGARVDASRGLCRVSSAESRERSSRGASRTSKVRFHLTTKVSQCQRPPGTPSERGGTHPPSGGGCSRGSLCTHCEAPSRRSRRRRNPERSGRCFLDAH
jgi:hypothetical protein